MSEVATTMNVGTVDRALRVIIGVVLLLLVFVGPRTAWGYLGLVFIVTGIMGRCPVYSALGLSTAHKPQPH